jgi:hypothetical protein
MREKLECASKPDQKCDFLGRFICNIRVKQALLQQAAHAALQHVYPFVLAKGLNVFQASANKSCGVVQVFFESREIHQKLARAWGCRGVNHDSSQEGI